MRLPLSAPFPRRRPASGLAALLLLFIAALVLATTPGPAQAQTTVKLVGNTGQTSWGKQPPFSKQRHGVHDRQQCRGLCAEARGPRSQTEQAVVSP